MTDPAVSTDLGPPPPNPPITGSGLPISEPPPTSTATTGTAPPTITISAPLTAAPINLGAPISFGPVSSVTPAVVIKALGPRGITTTELWLTSIAAFLVVAATLAVLIFSPDQSTKNVITSGLGNLVKVVIGYAVARGLAKFSQGAGPSTPPPTPLP